LSATIHAMFRQWLQRWIQARNPVSNPRHLTARTIFILPSAFGWAYGIVFVTITTGAVNYQLNAAFLLVFLLLIIGLLSMWETHHNLQGLTIQCLAVENTQQGQPARVRLLLTGKKSMRQAVIFCFREGEPVKLQQLAADGDQIVLSVQTPQRGCFQLPLLQIYSYYPLGIFCAWSYARFNIEYYVYPQAMFPGFWPATTAGQNLQQSGSFMGDEELYELKSVTSPWNQPGRIAWKVSARGQGWYLKTMTSPAGENWLFRIEDLIGNDIELNLQQLSYWIQQAEQLGHRYGLQLRGAHTEISQGEQHMQDCLRQLATY